MSKAMQAVFYRQYGSADVLEVGYVPVPALTPDSVRIRVVAAGVNPADAVIRRGDLKLFTGRKFPKIPGNDVAGVVEAVGMNVTRFQPGDAVYAMTPNFAGGGYAQQVVVAAANVAHLTSPLTFAEAAAVPLTALTALQGLRDNIGLQPGMHLLINGASGGVGTFAVQMAKVMGAQVTAAASGRNLDFVRELGADKVLDYTRQNVTEGAQYDAVLDAAGVYSFAAWRGVLRPRGVVATVNPGFGNPLAVLRARFDRDGKRLRAFLVKPSGADLDVVGAWIAAGDIRPIVEQTYALTDAIAAQRQIETKRTRGKIVLIVDAALAGVTPAAASLSMQEIM